MTPQLAATTWVHKIFGGAIRSRVTCQTCAHNSDTTEPSFGMSVDVDGLHSLEDALKKYAEVDILSGDNSYRCSK